MIKMKIKKDSPKLIILLSIIVLVSIIFYSAKPKSGSVPRNQKTSDVPLPESLGPLGDLSKLNLTLECDLVSIPKYAPQLKVERISISNDTAEEIALNAFNFTKIEQIKKMRSGKLAVIEGTKRLYFYGLNDVYYQTLNDTTVVNKWTDLEIKSIADNFFDNLLEYWNVPTEADIILNTIKPCSTTFYDDGTQIINQIGVIYDVKVNGIKLCGPGADFWVAIAHNKVYDVELHIPSVSVEKYIEITLSPQEAVNRFISGRYSTEELGFSPIYGPIPKEGELIIKKVELSYFVDHRSDPPQTYLPLVYIIAGDIVGLDPFEAEIMTIEFYEIIPINK